MVHWLGLSGFTAVALGSITGPGNWDLASCAAMWPKKEKNPENYRIKSIPLSLSPPTAALILSSLVATSPQTRPYLPHFLRGQFIPPVFKLQASSKRNLWPGGLSYSSPDMDQASRRHWVCNVGRTVPDHSTAVPTACPGLPASLPSPTSFLPQGCTPPPPSS